jgi:hypothetical protein
MANTKNRLSDKQFRINQQAINDTLTANDWLHKQGLDANTFGATPTILLQAQHQAHTLMENYSNLLSKSQLRTIENFQNLIAHKRTRERQSPYAAYAVLNISSKINRQLFRQYRQTTKA